MTAAFAACDPDLFFSSFGSLGPDRKRLRRIGESDLSVLLRGETGTGKEFLARRLHAHSRRAEKPFLKLSCAALPFGRAEGVKAAREGAVFFDEIGDMPPGSQAELLQFLQEHDFQRPACRETVRVIAATRFDLHTAMREGRFREDLFYRLNVITLEIPPLRERKSEIVAMAEFFLAKYAGPGEQPPGIPSALRTALLEHPWPGNIRELENLIRMYLVLGDTNLVIDELRSRVSRAWRKETAGSVFEAAEEARRQAEKDAILEALNATRWNRRKAAALLNIDYKALLYRMKKLTLEDRPLRLAAKAS